MLRTRDYFLLIVTVVFLLVAIGTTIITRSAKPEVNYRPVTLVPEAEGEYVAVVEDSVELSRAERLARMREKIKDGASLFIYQEPEPEPVVEETDDTATEAGDETVAEMRCSNYQTFTGSWDISGIKFSAAEGIRLVYKEIPNPVAIQSGSSSAPVPPLKNVLLQLPIRGASLGAQHCISSDVIGVTLAGALIRNSDATVYAPTSENTLLGYALDGYPIYGSSNAPTDTCGGRLVAGQYQYQISTNRDTIINCFTGQPTKL